ncbi:MAG: proline dehydrogenase family protein [Flavobacteriales bacterium]
MESRPQPSFDNTEIAFGGKSNAELKRAYWLFRLIGNPALVTAGKFMTHAALALRIPIGWAIRGNIFKQFCGGETIAQCSRAMESLAQFGIGTILDYSVEGKDSEADLENTKAEIMLTIQEGASKKCIPFSVFKVTGIARFELLEKVNAGAGLSDTEQLEWERVQTRVDAICAHAQKLGVPVFIDAEDSWIQDAIDRLADAMMAKYNTQRAIVYNTIQLYRHDRLAFLKASFEKASTGNYFLGVKLVRGAYMEKERNRAADMGYTDPIQPDKQSSDRDFDAATLFCLDHIERISMCAGTHNEQSSLALAAAMDQRGIARNDRRVFFAQLFGMSDHISYNLANAGFNVAKYLPYGPIREVMPYLIRRAQENTSVKGQTGRELSLIQKEMKRRKLK